MSSISELIQKLADAGVKMVDALKIHKVNLAFEPEEVDQVLEAIAISHLKKWLKSQYGEDESGEGEPIKDE